MVQLVVIDASLSEAGSSTRLAHAIRSELPQEWAVEHVKLRPLARALADSLLVGFASSELEAVYNGVGRADAVLVVAPIYQSSYSGLLKLFLDLLPEGSLRGVPAIVAATGGSTRHALAVDYALRPLMTYLGAEVATTGIYAAAEDWGAVAADSTGEKSGSLRNRIKRAARQMQKMVEVRINLAENESVAGGTSSSKSGEVRGDMFASVTPFANLLAQVET
ncbi:MAG: NAD(P)H-dependent oxidoreductase [Buchananella hordeovulneris]|nr:NAD(P)H-dependent oxidoreductase [Buchananella hordeovulneris]